MQSASFPHLSFSNAGRSAHALYMDGNADAQLGYEDQRSAIEERGTYRGDDRVLVDTIERDIVQRSLGKGVFLKCYPRAFAHIYPHLCFFF